MAKTVFFGPFIGEFGWEILWWHGWVKELSRTVYRDARKIVASFPGRSPFYPDADEFWEHPEWFCTTPLSQRAYFTDFWRNGLPLGNIARKRFKYFIRPVQESVSIKSDGKWPEVETVALKLFQEYRKRLPADAECFVPFGMNQCPRFNIPIGLKVLQQTPQHDRDFVIYHPEFEHQRIERLQPTPRGIDFLAKQLAPGEPLICVLPRVRAVRRPDKNWPKERYDELIHRLQQDHPHSRVAILGDPRGAYYANGVPSGCIDLVNIDRAVRLDAQLAALNRAQLAVGGMSGGMVMALFSGCPSLVFGFLNEQHLYYRDNYLKTPLVYYPFMNASSKEISRLARGMIEQQIPPAGNEIWDPTQYFGIWAMACGRVRRYFSV